MTEIRLFWAIDPGATGACVTINSSANLLHKFDFTGQTETDIAEYFFGWWVPMSQQMRDRTMVGLEKVAAMPHDGRASLAKFMTHYGFLRGLLSAHKIPYRDIPPGQWQREMRLLCPKGTKAHVKKKKHLVLAQQLYPKPFEGLTQKSGLAICDAILMSEWMRRRQGAF